MFVVFFNDTATTEIYTLSLHDALPIYHATDVSAPLTTSYRGYAVYETSLPTQGMIVLEGLNIVEQADLAELGVGSRSEEHTSELQSRQYLVCRLLLEKKKKSITTHLCT